MRLFTNPGQVKYTVEPGACMYGYHPIPAGEPYIAVLYSRERFERGAVTVDDCGAVLFACMEHAPSEGGVIAALQAAGMPAVA